MKSGDTASAEECVNCSCYKLQSIPCSLQKLPLIFSWIRWASENSPKHFKLYDSLWICCYTSPASTIRPCTHWSILLENAFWLVILTARSVRLKCRNKQEG